jgi:carbohydrate kinase (thermoresistant glucokinase family)
MSTHAHEYTVIVLMGVAGSGKSTLGAALASRWACPFYDADNYHPQANIDKMRRGEPLNDTDRAPWLRSLSQIIADCVTQDQRAVMACSALKHSYRKLLLEEVASPKRVGFVFLQPSRETLRRRLEQRVGHFMPASLLESQQQALEVRGDDPYILVKFVGAEAELPPEELIAKLLHGLMR